MMAPSFPATRVDGSPPAGKDELPPPFLRRVWVFSGQGEGTQITEWALQHSPVDEHQRVERLALGACRDVPIDRQMLEKMGDFPRAQVIRLIALEYESTVRSEFPPKRSANCSGVTGTDSRAVVGCCQSSILAKS